MKIWNAAPLIRLLLPFIAGILLAIGIPVPDPLITITFSLFFIGITIFTFTVSIHRSYHISWLYGVLIFVFLFLTGYQLTILKTDQLSSDHFSRHLKQSDYACVRIASACVEKEKSIKATVEILILKKKGNVIPVIGKAIIYFQKDAHSIALATGDELFLKNKFNDIAGPKNPGEFNYRRFLFYKGIYHQAFLKTNEWVYTGKNSGNPFMNYALQLRDKLLCIFKAANLNRDEYAVATALLIGYTDKLDPDLLSAYAGTGVLHVLSVSGMHVAIVFVVFSKILFFLDRLKYGASMKAILLIFFLWFYAFLSGLSPSVLRAATMFSFIVCARSFRRHTYIYNTLAASALFLLLWNPYLIMDVGFQLSYLAVAGIVYLQAWFSDMVTTTNRTLKQLTDLLCVSIAAQLATLPVCIYNFHQFPNYFLLSNLLVIPLSTCIIYMGMILIVVSGNIFLFKYASIIFSKTLTLLNGLVVFISKLPYAISDNLEIGIPEMCLLYGVIIAFHLFLVKRKSFFFKFSLVTTILLLVFQVIKQQETRKQKKWMVYSIPGVSAVDFIAGRNHILLLDTTNSEHDQKWMQHVKPNWSRLGLQNSMSVSLKMKTAFVCIQDKTVKFFDQRLIVLNNEEETEQLYLKQQTMVMDYVIVSKNIHLSMLQIKEVYQPKCIVFDGSNAGYICKMWEKECAALHQPCYSVTDSGAFIVSL